MRIITRSERINFASPIWSADGQYVIAARTGQLWMYNTDGGSGVQLTGLRPEGAAPAGAAGTPASHYGAAPSGDTRLWVLYCATTLPPASTYAIRRACAARTAGRVL